MSSGLLLLTLFLVAPLTSDAQPTVVRSVLGNGPTVATDGTTTVAATIGQPVIGLTQQDALGVYQGFWGGTLLRLSVDDRPTFGSSDQVLVSSASPNPTSGPATAWVTLPASGTLTATLHDGLGRELVRLADEEREAGVHRLRIDASGLSSGVYYLRVVVDGVVRTTAVVVEQ